MLLVYEVFDFFFLFLGEIYSFQLLARLEQETGLFFNVNYLEDLVTNGHWDEIEKYLSGFPKLHDNSHSL